MRAPPGYLKDSQEGKVLKLKWSLPGLKQARFKWAEELAGAFYEMRFSQLKVDQAVYFKCTSTKHIIILRDIWPRTIELAIRSQGNQRQSRIHLNGFTESIHWHHCQIIPPRQCQECPNAYGSRKHPIHRPVSQHALQAMHNVPYQWAIGLLIYMAISTYPGIVFMITMLLQFMWNPSRPHWEATKHAIQYLKGTAEFELTLGSTDAGIEAFINTDWALQPHRYFRAST